MHQSCSNLRPPPRVRARPPSCAAQAVACQAAPATLKAAFLDPVREQLATEVAVDLFGRSDSDYMSMFTGACGGGTWGGGEECLPPWRASLGWVHPAVP